MSAELMELADQYAKAAATAYVEDLYGTSQSYTAECQRKENAARSALHAALAATAQPAPAAVPADLHAYMLQHLKRERAALDGFIALGNEAPRAAKFDRWIAALLAAAPQQAPTGGAE
jgi:hypothetical protein